MGLLTSYWFCSVRAGYSAPQLRRAPDEKEVVGAPLPKNGRLTHSRAPCKKASQRNSEYVSRNLRCRSKRVGLDPSFFVSKNLLSPLTRTTTTAGVGSTPDASPIMPHGASWPSRVLLLPPPRCGRHRLFLSVSYLRTAAASLIPTERARGLGPAARRRMMTIISE